LCVKAAREVEASRVLITAQSDTIKALEQQSAALVDKVRAQNELLDLYRKGQDQTDNITKKYQEIIDNKDKLIANQEKEIEVLKNKKPSIFTRITDVLIGVGVGIILK